jgi:hypothetical protein
LPARFGYGRRHHGTTRRPHRALQDDRRHHGRRAVDADDHVPCRLAADGGTAGLAGAAGAVAALTRAGRRTGAPGESGADGQAVRQDGAALEESSETIDDLNARAKDAAKEAVKDAGNALSRLAKPGSMVSGRVICPVLANGTPDCKLGADRLCQSKGYQEGKSLNTDSAHSSSTKVLIPGRARKPDDCHADNYVTTALCQ